MTPIPAISCMSTHTSPDENIWICLLESYPIILIVDVTIGLRKISN